MSLRLFERTDIDLSRYTPHRQSHTYTCNNENMGLKWCSEGVRGIIPLLGADIDLEQFDIAQVDWDIRHREIHLRMIPKKIPHILSE